MGEGLLSSLVAGTERLTDDEAVRRLSASSEHYRRRSRCDAKHGLPTPFSLRCDTRLPTSMPCALTKYDPDARPGL
jgi:hypothetical protein